MVKNLGCALKFQVSNPRSSAYFCGYVSVLNLWAWVIINSTHRVVIIQLINSCEMLGNMPGVLLDTSLPPALSSLHTAVRLCWTPLPLGDSQGAQCPFPTSCSLSLMVYMLIFIAHRLFKI